MACDCHGVLQNFLRRDCELRSVSAESANLAVILRVPAEVGESWELPLRLPHHAKNTGTNSLFGWFHAVTTHRLRSDALELTQLVPFQVWERDKELMGLAESINSVLHCAYHDFGGLNPFRAGPKKTGCSDKHAASSKAAERAVLSRDFIKPTVHADVVAMNKRLELYEYHDKRDETERSLCDLERDVKEVQEQRDQLRTQVNNLQRQVNDKEAAAKALEEQARAARAARTARRLANIRRLAAAAQQCRNENLTSIADKVDEICARYDAI